MSLMKLLTVSRSLVAEKSMLGRYKMAEQGMLPKFAPVGRMVSLAPNPRPDEPAPFRFKPGSVTDREEVKTDATTAPPLMSQTSKGEVSFASPINVTMPAVVPVTQSVLCVNAIPAPTNWFRLRKNPFDSGSGKKHKPQTSEQAELSLDAVRPLRNDLCDADLEIVPVKPVTGLDKSRGPKLPQLSKPALTGMTWSRLTARLFNSGRARA